MTDQEEITTCQPSYRLPTLQPNSTTEPVILFSTEETTDILNDCACPSPPTYTHKVQPQGSLYYSSDDVLTLLLPKDFYLVFEASMPKGVVVLNQMVFDRYLSFRFNAKPLHEPQDYLLAELGLLIAVGSAPQTNQQLSKTLTAWLHVTNACNLECPYCYVRKSNVRMDSQIGVRAIETLFASAQQNDFDTLKLKYAGGEATLHYKLIQQLHAEASRHAEVSQVNLQEVLLSNGVAIRSALADWLAETPIKLSISVDGIGLTHDQQRPLKGGKPSFGYIQRTIDEVLLPRNIRPNITITVTSLNADHIDEAIQWVLERKLPFSLNFYRENILSKPYKDLAIEENLIIQGMRKAYLFIEQNIPSYPFLDGLLDRVQSQAHTRTCGVGKNYVVITHTGTVAQCQMHLDTPVGNLLDNQNIIPLIASGAIQNIPVEEKQGCQKCIFRYRCAGGCPLETFRVTKRWDVQSPNCQIYQTLYPQALRLEGLRLMKLNGYI